MNDLPARVPSLPPALMAPPPPPPPPSGQRSDMAELLGRVKMAAVVRPGDTLVFALTELPGTPRDLANIKAQLQQLLPGVKVAIVAGVESMAVIADA